ncbi:MAG: hypothetical protein IKT46_06705 [Clostridia bacterium]|nr:hypothetical protein [Clostridia bacterium]
MKRILSLILCTAMLVSAFAFNISAYEGDARLADPHTLDDWQHLFGEGVIHTGNAGAVWSDKSVLTDPSVLGVELTDECNFAVALSALASDMNIIGYSGVPADTMLIIESSDIKKSLDYIDKAVDSLYGSNNHNRIGAVIYSKEASYILPISKYAASVASSLVKAEDCHNFQQAMYKAYELFMAIDDTTIEGEGIQSGSKRLPVFLMMTKSDFTEASSNFADLWEADLTTKNEEYAHLVPFAMQLTAAYAKAAVEKHYDHEAFVYTLGSVSGLFDTTATATCWDIYEQAPEESSVQLASDKVWVRDNGGYWQTLYKSFKKSTYQLSRDFITEYYSTEAHFDTVIGKIIEHSLNDPTYVEGGDDRVGGYIEFIDDIGRYMEVKDVKGIRLAGKLYTGVSLAQNFVPGGGLLGAVASPNELGNEMIWSVMERLGIEELSTAQQLISLAYRSGQLSYNKETGEYSNYIGWYADKDGKFIGHAKDGDKTYPDGTVFYNKSYGFTGAVADGYKASDMMYISVQIHTRITTGTQAVIFRIPAALIPVINYNVSYTGQSLEDPGDITLEYDNKIKIDTVGNGIPDTEVDITPIRLVYEVGLRSDIDDITVNDLVDPSYEHIEDGVYTFYTNRWDTEDIGHAHPSEAKNTVSFFEPSPENERYYYTHNTTVYECTDGEYTPYKGSSAPVYESGRYFRAHNVYEYSDSASGGNAIIHTHYEEISEDSLNKAVKSSSGWYIPKGTVYRYFEDHEHLKTENTTGTISYSHYVNIEDRQGDAYYVDYILGNNGKMTLKAATGVKLSVNDDETTRGRYDKVGFEISAPDGRYRLVSYDGGKTVTELNVTEGKAILELGMNTEVYIADLPAGADIDIRMLTEGKDYCGKDGDSITLTVEETGFVTADFTATLVSPVDSGLLVLDLDVVHPLGEDADATYHQFSFDVSYDGKTEAIALRHGESAVIKDIPVGCEVTITQKDLPDGFTSDKEDNTQRITVEEAGIYISGFVNTYAPKAVSLADVTLTGDVELTGRALFTDDLFTYKLQRYNGKTWVDMAQLSVTGDDPTFDFTAVISSESFEAPGVYSYRVLPVISQNPYNGVSFDKTVRWFEVTVSDNNWDGSYEISGIVGFNGAIVAKNNYKWSLYTSFFSEYKPSGSDAVSIVADTLIEGTKELPLDGYVYGLYQNGALTDRFVSDINGEAVITLGYSVADIGNTVEYTVKQIIPDMPIANMSYSDKEYKVTVKVYDDLMGNVRAAVILEDEEAREAHLTFVNSYSPPATDSESKDKDTTTTPNTQSGNKKPSSTSPLTGDRGILIPCVLLAASALIIVIILCTKKKKTVS